MIGWLDWRLFGNGNGLGLKKHGLTLHYLDGRFYKYSPGLGAQLYSFEWRKLAPGTKRRLANRTFRVLCANRRGPRVMVAWGMVPAPNGFELQAFKHDLDDPPLEGWSP